MRAFTSPADVMSAACELQDRLGFIEETEAADAIGTALFATWRTSSESMLDIARALTEVRPVVRRTLDEEAVAVLDATVAGARDLAEPVQQPSLVRSLLRFLKR